MSSVVTPCSHAGATGTAPVSIAFSNPGDYPQAACRPKWLHRNRHPQKRRPLAPRMNFSMGHRGWDKEEFSRGEISITASQRTVKAANNCALFASDNFSRAFEVPF